MQNTRSLTRFVGSTIILALACCLPLQLVDAEYTMPDLANVPVERLIKNLEVLARNNPKDAELRLNLARAHAMAFAQKTEAVRVLKGREDKGVWFGYEHYTSHLL